ncbi:MAG: hypothetical protein GF383_07395 [Candidatus Lokiarchaeota archaeon]|nr:hypothetical protein [Candidatus Lokiarchaeota archaeon]MBD3340014.1 hypothetical protein [Candidatus Lokiarchaeota archaeon]
MKIEKKIKRIKGPLHLRKCYYCPRTITFEEYVKTNPGFSLEWLIKIWNSPHVEIMCCACYDGFTKSCYKCESTEDLITLLDGPPEICICRKCYRKDPVMIPD